MTDAEWLATTRPTGMLLFLRSGGSPRKLLLFNLACCRRVWDLLGDEDRRRFVQADAVADDQEATTRLVAELEPERMASLALGGLRDLPVTDEQAHLLRSQSKLRLYIDTELNWAVAALAFHAAELKQNELDHPEREAEERSQADLLRCIFGNPFRPVAFDAHWRTADVLGLARGIYEDRAFDRMPLLADALMDAGCDSEDILAHCRLEGPHVRGCWVVDGVLGKE